MHSVDKWLDGKELEQDEVNRAATMREKTLQIVEKLTEESESLKQCMEHEHASFMETFGEYGEKCDKLAEENERLRAELAKSYNALDEQMNFYCSFTQSKIQNCPIDDEVAKAKTDTVRKMQERLKAYFGTYVLGYKIPLTEALKAVDQIAKEMLEEVNTNGDKKD
jgi:hypothetical protein